MNLLHKIARSKGDPKVLRKGKSSLAPHDSAARYLGWFSIGIGLIELVAAQRIGRSLGVEGREPLIRAFGARETSSGILLLSVERDVGMWSGLPATAPISRPSPLVFRRTIRSGE